MRIVKQHTALPVQNFDNFIPQSNDCLKKRHGELLPNTIRGIFVGASASGKTNSLLTLIFNPHGLRFENVYLYSKTINQPKYKLLSDVLKSVQGVEYFPYSEHTEVISPENAKPNSLMIFDDIICEKQDHVRAFFCQGRHSLVDSFYLCQTYSRIPKHLIRDNSNFLVLFKQDETNLKHIYNDHVNTDFSYEVFKKMCLHCWNSDKYGFIVIDKDRDLNNGRYRQGFDNFISIQS